MNHPLIFWGGVLGFLAVAAGAFGAHALEDRLDPDQLDAYETAARYQLVHSVVLLVLGVVVAQRGMPLRIPYTILAGTVLFSGSIYLLIFTDTAWIGPVTPLGGLLLLAGWAQTAVWALRSG